jgi:hypothetical protein
MAKEDYWRRALKTLHLKQRRDDHRLNLGSFKIIESDAALDGAVDARLRVIHAEQRYADEERFNNLDEVDPGNGNSQLDREVRERQWLERTQSWQAEAFLRYTDYKRHCSNIDALESRLSTARYHHRDQIDQVARKKFVSIHNSTRHTSDRSGYRRYLRDQTPQFYNRVLNRSVRAYVDEVNHRQHTYVVGTTKSGKTELLKALAFEYMQADTASVVFLDPAGDASRQIARWLDHQMSGRLIYMDLGLAKGYTPTINPFDSEGMSAEEKVVLTQQIFSAFAEILKGDLGGALSVNMRALLIPSIRLLLDMRGATLRDLEKLMNDDPNLVALGTRSPHSEIATFFARDYNRPSLRTSKQSVANKLASILNTGVFERLTCGPSTINLQEALASKKIVVCNLAQGRLGEEETQAFGKLLIALIQGIGIRRESIPESQRPMTHLIVDECQNFITPSIIKIIEETRKYGLAVTLAQLSVGRGMSPEMAHVVSNIPHVRVVGAAGFAELKRSGTLVGVDPEELATLRTGQFFYKAGSAPAFRLHARGDLIKFNRSMARVAWKSMRNIQKDLYYRRIEDGAEHVPTDHPTVTRETSSDRSDDPTDKREFR